MKSDLGELGTDTQQPTDYTNFIVLVCNFPDKKWADDREKLILEGFSKKWEKNHNDPYRERVHIIYLHKDDTWESEKFELLQVVDSKSLIYIIGHCRPGSDGIKSDEIYNLPNLETNQVEKQAFSFSHEWLASILINNIKNPEVCIPRRPPTEKSNLNYPFNPVTRRLRIIVPSCHSAVDQVDKQGIVIERAFAAKLLESLNNNFDQMMVCDVIGSRGYVAPVAGEPNFAALFKFMLKRTTNPTTFHKRYLFIENHWWSTLIPRHQPEGVDYKSLYMVASGSTDQDFQNQQIQVVRLPMQEGETRLQQQITAQKALDLCNIILNDDQNPHDEEIIRQALLIQKDLTSGIYNVNHVNTFFKSLNTIKNKQEITKQRASLCEILKAMLADEYTSYYDAIDKGIRITANRLKTALEDNIPDEEIRPEYLKFLKMVDAKTGSDLYSEFVNISVEDKNIQNEEGSYYQKAPF